GAPFIESVKPCPKMATGQPPTGFVPDGTKRVNSRLSIRCTAGTPVSVPTGGMVCVLSSYCRDEKEPYAIDAIEPGKTCVESAGSGLGDSGPATIVWRFQVIVSAGVFGNTVREPSGASRKFATGAGADRIWSRIFSEIAVMLCVVKRLASAMSLGC